MIRGWFVPELVKQSEVQFGLLVQLFLKLEDFGVHFPHAVFVVVDLLFGLLYPFHLLLVVLNYPKSTVFIYSCSC